MSQWHYKLGENEHGPVSFTELVELVRLGAITESVPVRRAPSDTWVHAWTIEMLFTVAKRSVVDPAASGSSPEARIGPDGPSAGDVTRRSVSSGPMPSLPAPVRVVKGSTFARYRWSFAAAVSFTVVLAVYRWSYWQKLTFPRAARPGEQAADFVFPLVGHCTALECVLLYFEVAIAVGAIAWWLFRWVERKQ